MTTALSSTALELPFDTPSAPPPAGHPDRFARRWRLAGAGLSNVWRFGDLVLPAPSGRLLLRGPNGTGKTTALEVLWPFLLDLNAARLAAGKARPTSLRQLMSEAATSRRRYGYAWLTFAPPRQLIEAGTEAELVSYGVRLQYAAGSSPQVRLVPFRLPGVPLSDVDLYGANRSALETEEFTRTIREAGGEIFADEAEYADDLARRVWQSSAAELQAYAAVVREVRNPTLLADVSPAGAAQALRGSLPGVAESVLSATADALAESAVTRAAFERDQLAATVLSDFAATWAGHAAEVVQTAAQAHHDATLELRRRRRAVGNFTRLLGSAETAEREATSRLDQLSGDHARLQSEVRAVELSAAYREAGRLRDLQTALTAELLAARSERSKFRDTTAHAAERTRRGREDLRDRLEDVTAIVREATAAGAEPVAPGSLLSWTEFARRNFLFAEELVEAGFGLRIEHDPAVAERTAATWRARGDQRAARAGAAQLSLKDHREVAAANQEFQARHRVAEQTERGRDEAEQTARQLTAAAHTAAGALRRAVRSWAGDHPDLRGLSPDAEESAGRPAEAEVWDEGDLDQLEAVEPAQLLDRLNGWAELAVRLGERQAARAEAEAGRLDESTRTSRAEAAELRHRAAALRSGELLPLPRPAWAGEGDDAYALGTALEWRSQGTPDDAERDRIELALAHSGMLGARLADDGAGTDRWQVSARGPELAGDTLADVLTVDPDHELAAVAAAVLRRVRLDARLVPDGSDGDDGDDGDNFVIGRDGGFRAGPLRFVADDLEAPMAVHIGARRRREAARAEADRLDAAATEASAAADAQAEAARALRTGAADHRLRAAGFPDRSELAGAEARRATAAVRLGDLDARATAERAEAERLREVWSGLRADWVDRVTALGLPTEPDALAGIVDTDRRAAGVLAEQARRLLGAWAGRLERTRQELPDEDALREQLVTAYGEVQQADRRAERTAALVEELRRSVGDPQEAVDRHRRLTEELTQLGHRIEPARSHVLRCTTELSKVTTQLEGARAELHRAEPAAQSTAAHLRLLLSQPAVATVLGELAAGVGDDDLQEWTAERLIGQRPIGRRQLSERYDQASATLAGSWSLTHGDAGAGLGDLDLIVLSHADAEYTPPAAAVRARELATRAEQALAAAESAALNDFVIGRLPTAIGSAWIRLQDWKAEVNRKMRSAEASSGVGVQVQIDLAGDLPAHVRTVYELSCRVSDADRTPEQKVRVGEALQSLLAGADGESMVERLRDAVDIRGWVDVHYLVTRPDPRNAAERVSGRWTSRTGLSGGERRLVVLAPMLAALAAAGDRLGPAGLRLIALDEVPAEVDERGRQGLARFLAELDLDLIATSYLWDGAPGAWDGVDAHDLEVAGDGTVVAFWMLLRGTDALPGDPSLHDPSSDSSHDPAPDALSDEPPPDP